MITKCDAKLVMNQFSDRFSDKNKSRINRWLSGVKVRDIALSDNVTTETVYKPIRKLNFIFKYYGIGKGVK